MKHFLAHFLELQCSMGLGALVCYALGRLIPTSTSLAIGYRPGTYLFAIGDVLFMTIPVVGWASFRGHDWRHRLELAGAMLAPVAAIVVLAELAGIAYLLWLVIAMYPAMSVGMLIYMITRRDHFRRPVRQLRKFDDPERDAARHTG